MRHHIVNAYVSAPIRALKRATALAALKYLIAGLAVLALACAAKAEARPRLVHVFVALADNANQGIVPVPAAIGNGEDAAHNLYWGASLGVRSYFRKAAEWKQISVMPNPSPEVLERIVFQHRASGTLMVADAYRGTEIKRAVSDFFRAASGRDAEITELAGVAGAAGQPPLKPSLVAYVGHDVLMEPLALLQFAALPRALSAGAEKREAIVLACMSQRFFAHFLRPTGAEPLLWTTQLMAPEAYTLKAALDGWIAGEKPEQIRTRAGAAYAKYQNISLRAAKGVFATGW